MEQWQTLKENGVAICGGKRVEARDVAKASVAEPAVPFSDPCLTGPVSHPTC